MGATRVSRPGLATDNAHILRRDHREVRPKPIRYSATGSVTQAGTSISVSVVVFRLAGIVLAIPAAAGLPIPQRAPWVTAIYVLNSLSRCSCMPSTSGPRPTTSIAFPKRPFIWSSCWVAGQAPSSLSRCFATRTEGPGS